MNQLLVTLRHDMFDPDTLTGAVLLGIIFLLAATMIVRTLRRATRHVESHLSDVTGVHFASALGQVFAYLIAFVLYAHLVPGLRALGTALLAGVSVVSVVLGLAAQNTLGNLVSGLSLVLYRPVKVGDRVKMNTPKGLVTATVHQISLGDTTLRDSEMEEILVPNSVMMSSVLIRPVDGARKGGRQP
ncbi:MAG: mechanosensitive ion channel family protein [Gammaproteobacteria bacterium]|nr:mechanosensitive ion channel family protein [Gammaproteobacteria bacterium]